jgi:hypothetical protein
VSPAPATAPSGAGVPTRSSPFFSERWATPAGAAPFADTFQARVPPVPLEPAHDRPPDAGTNGTSNGNSNANSSGPAEEDRDDQGTPTDADRTSRPEPDVSHR